VPLQDQRQQKILWAEARRETGRGKDRCKTQDLFAGGRCSQPILDFPSTTDAVPAPAEEDVLSDASEWELQRREKEEERRAEAEELGAGGFFCLFVYSLLACDLWRSWRDYVQSSSCPLSAQWRHVASTSLPAAQACPENMWCAPRKLQRKERRKCQRPPPKPFLRSP